MAEQNKLINSLIIIIINDRPLWPNELNYNIKFENSVIARISTQP